MEGRDGSSDRVTVRQVRVLKKKPRRRYHIAIIVVIALVLPIFLMLQPGARGEDYTFDSEDVIQGISEDSGNRDVEDSSYQQLIEEDWYENTNFSGSSEDVALGTAGGDAFPGSLDDDDGSYRTYTEEDTGGEAPGSYDLYIYPNGDILADWNLVVPGGGDHYIAVDETTEGGDDGTSYVEASANNVEDRFAMDDLSNPGTGYTLDVAVFAVHYKGSSQPNEFQAGIRIGSTNYEGIDVKPTNGAYVNSSSPIWMLNPATTAEWTYIEVTALVTYITTNDASPNVRCTQVGLHVQVNFSSAVNYELDVEITFSGVANTSQTTGYYVFCQGYRSGTEDFDIFVYDYVGEGWNLKDSVDQASDTDFNFALTVNEHDHDGDEVILRIIGHEDESDDDCQCTVTFDVLKVSRIELGYALDVEMTAPGTNEYGNQTLIIVGYTTTEDFYVGLYNYTDSSWDEQVLTITALGNSPHFYELNSDQRSDTQEVKVNFTDADVYTSDQVKDTLYLDLVILSWNHSDPTITLYGSDSPKNAGSAISLWANYTDADNEAPTYMKVNISGTTYDMTKNITDTSSWNGISHYYSTDALSAGIYDYNFTTTDASSGIITTPTDQLTINGAPTLTEDGVTPATGNNGDTFTFFVIYTDLYNNDTPSYIQVVIDGTPYAMDANDSGDYVFSDGKSYHYDKAMAAGDYPYYFQTADYLSAQVTTTPKDLTVNNIPTLSGGTRQPTDPVYVDTTLYFNVTFTDIDGDLPDNIKWREDTGTTQNESMSEVDAGDADTTDGKVYTFSTTLGHGVHTFDFYADDGNGSVSGEGDTVTIVNRVPTIDNDPGESSEYRNTYWEFDFEGTDPDTDNLVWQMTSNATFLSINSASGLVNGTTSDPVAWYSTTVWANDSYGGNDSLYFGLNVTNRAPVIGSSGNTTQTNDTFMSYNIQATDGDTDVLTYDFNSNNTDLAIDNHWVNGTVTVVGWYECNVWVNDSYGGSDYEHWHLTVTEAVENSAPYFTSTPIYSVANNTFYSYDSNASDAENDTLWYNFTSNCTELSIHHDLGFINGTPVGIGTYYVNITVWDTNVSGGNLSAHQNYTLTLTNTLPEFTSSATTTGTVGVAYSYDADATDANDDTLVYDLEYTNATWLFINNDSGLVEGTPTSAGFFIVNISVFDNIGYDFQNYSLELSAAGAEPGPGPIGYITADDMETCMFGMIIGMIAVMMFFMMKRNRRTKGKDNKRVKSG